MERKEIRSDYKEKKHFAKATYRKQKHEIKEVYQHELDKYYSSEEFVNKNNPPRHSVLEEIGNAVTHGVGAIFAIVAYVLMLLKCNTTVEFISASIYFLGMFLMFVMSCLYHSFRYGSKVKRVFRRFDYSSIYLLIGATFTPILLCFFCGIYGTVFCSMHWALIAVGITFVSIFGPTRVKWLHFPLCIALGWSAILFIPKMTTESLPLFFWILAGGGIYTLGVIPFSLRKKVSHFLWHFFVLAGAIIQWIGIYLYIYCI